MNLYLEGQQSTQCDFCVIAITILQMRWRENHKKITAIVYYCTSLKFSTLTTETRINEEQALRR